MTTLLAHTLARIADALDVRAAGHDLEWDAARRRANEALGSQSHASALADMQTFRALAIECRDIARALRNDTLAGCPDIYPDPLSAC